MAKQRVNASVMNASASISRANVDGVSRANGQGGVSRVGVECHVMHPSGHAARRHRGVDESGFTLGPRPLPRRGSPG